MSKPTLDLLSLTQGQRIDRIKDYHGQFKANAKNVAVAAMLCGFELTILKQITPHGDFMKLREAYFAEISERTTNHYMRLCDAAQAKSATVADLISDAVAAPDKQLPAPKEEVLLETFHDLADSKSVTELYREAGIIRQPTPPGGFRPDAKALQKWLKEHHPDLAGTKYDDLPVTIQKAFRKQYQPVVDPALLAETARDSVKAAFETLMREHDARAIADHFTMDTPEHVALFETWITFLSADLLPALRAQLKGAGSRRRKEAVKSKKSKL